MGLRVAVQSRWDIVILQGLQQGFNRPALLQRAYPHLPRRTLYRRLKHLRQAGLIEALPQPPQGVAMQVTEQGRRWLQALQRLEAAGLRLEQILQLCPLLQCPCRLKALQLLLRQPMRPRVLVVGLRLSSKRVFEHLKRLQRLRIVRRQVVPTRPVQVRYTLTPQGQQIAHALVEARQLLTNIPRNAIAGVGLK